MVCDAGDALDSAFSPNTVIILPVVVTNLVKCIHVVIGGGVAGYGEKLFAPLRERVPEQFHVASEALCRRRNARQ